MVNVSKHDTFYADDGIIVAQSSSETTLLINRFRSLHPCSYHDYSWNFTSSVSAHLEPLEGTNLPAWGIKPT